MTSLAAKQAAESIRPQQRLPASVWAERERRIMPGTSAQPGRWSNDYLPWAAPMLDGFDENPWAEGAVLMKPAQSGGTEVWITKLGHLFTYDPGPTLFLTTTILQARKFSIERFDYMIENSPSLRRRFLRGKAAHETTLVKMAIGGSLIIAGSGSPNEMISNPCRWVFIDEEDRLPDFPGMGSAREIAEKRVEEYGTRTRVGIFSWAHPTTPEAGIASLFNQQSDKREWTIDCPHCERLIVMRWQHVKIPERDAARAEYCCPGCGKVISDAERWAATRRGRFVSQLDDREACQRRFLGYHISRLCHPRVPLLRLARRYTACHSESQLRVFFNMDMGEPYLEASFVMTEELVRARVDERLEGRRAPADTRFITCGVDVQKGATGVVLYIYVAAWTANGNCVLLEYGRLLGWPALDSLLRTFEAPCGESVLRIKACAIDHGWRTQEVYTFCRLDHAGVPCVPVKHAGGVTREQGSREHRTTDPLHPEFGAIRRLELCRDHWMDRIVGRYHPEADSALGGSVVLPPNIGDEFIAHIKSPIRVEIVDRHGHGKITWAKEKGQPDDWLQAGVYAEVAAVGVGLDRLHEGIPQAPPEREQAIEEGHVRRRARTHGRAPAYVRGRRRHGRGT